MEIGLIEVSVQKNFEMLTATQFKSSQQKSIKNAKLFPDKNIRMFVILKSSKRHHNKSYDYENNKKTGKTQKI